ncbi:MAG: hypothetical protein EBX52_06435, partial [Proteobacteria bacterium]|nr:hypothetical protein [Pseudomonadota bacterium]
MNGSSVRFQFSVSGLVLTACLFLNPPGARAQGAEPAKFEPPARTRVLEIHHSGQALLEGSHSGPWMPAFRNPTRDPVTGVQYKAVVYGPVERSYNPFSSYSLWRYVTVYRSDFVREAISDLPAIHQSCFDGGRYPIGNWQISRTISVELRSSLKAGDIGLGAEISASISQGRTFSLQRALIVPEGIEADYAPVLRQESWRGVTFIQTYEPSNGRLGYIPQSFWDRVWGDYPVPFALGNVSTVFEVER